MMDLLIRNGYVYQQNGEFKRNDLAIKDGKIVSISSTNSALTSKAYIDATGLYVLPGIIDSHVHFKEPAKHPESTENFFSGTSASAAGGVTTIIEMPNSYPCTYNKELLTRRRDIIQDQAVVDYALYGAAGNDHYAEIVPLGKEGIVAYKTFMHSAPKGREDEYEGFTMTTDADLIQGFSEISKTGLPLAVHAENDELITFFTQQVTDPADFKSHLHVRNLVVETSAIHKLLYFAKQFNVPLIICHVSSPEALALIKTAKEQGVRVYAETCPHYLIYDESYVEKLGPHGKCNPPLRSTEQVNKMWDFIRDGTIDYISSDHSPAFKADKEKWIGNILRSPAGFPGAELVLPLMLHQVAKGRLSLARVVQLLSENPAKAFDLYPQKGSLQAGTDADITIVDLEAKKKIDSSQMITRARDAAILFDGLEIRGLPIYTIVRGHLVAKNGEIQPDVKGWGKWIEPQKKASVQL
ncbi:dihydroorotase [Alkalihalobacillus oceani]|uniref:Dihydroorotase n=1 Tax=Halalkalibacter oceani TaxID=1653776 RepID=A0A9X2DRL4_9BACI|nr:dihydroorotase [Halalkalibacter oceani]MCM3714430.1 dihydroorotase [Halalkalibacter oceani]